jgi:hypothetical protein
MPNPAIRTGLGAGAGTGAKTAIRPGGCGVLGSFTRPWEARGAPDGNPFGSRAVLAELSNPFTYRLVAQKGWSGLRTVEDVRYAVGILEDQGWVKTVEVPRTAKGDALVSWCGFIKTVAAETRPFRGREEPRPR